jgi:transposase
LGKIFEETFATDYPPIAANLVKEFPGKQRGRIWLERLPAYAPELNPVE